MTHRHCKAFIAYPIFFCLTLILQGAALCSSALPQEKAAEVSQEVADGRDQDQTEASRWPEVSEDAVFYQTDFSKDWEEKQWTLHGNSWKHKPDAEPPVLSQFQKTSEFKPPFRSPFHMGMLNLPIEGDFVIEATVKSTHEDYGHRDVCLFLGFHDPGHFYYVHLGKKTDPHANQIFIVNGEDRKSISLTTTEGTNWDHNWHRVRIERRVSTGDITVWFDDLEKPVMTANDTTFLEPGQIGVGSFDDTADFSFFRVYKFSKGKPKAEALEKDRRRLLSNRND